MPMTQREFSKKLLFLLIVGVALVVCLGITSSAVLIGSKYWESENVQIWLNNEEPIITDDDIVFEPGVTAVRDFEVRNDGNTILSYRLYFDNVEGDLADVIVVTIRKGDKVLYEGTISQLNKYDTRNADDFIRPRQSAALTIEFHYPEEASMLSADSFTTFDLWAVGVPHAGAGGDDIVDGYVAEQDAIAP